MRIILHFCREQSLTKVLKVVLPVVLESPEELLMTNPLMDEIFLLGLCVIFTVTVPTLMKNIVRIRIRQEVDALLRVPLEPVHFMTEDDVLHQLRGVTEHSGAGAHDALQGHFLTA